MPAEKGWELYRQSYKATFDNSENPGDFRYVRTIGNRSTASTSFC